MYEEPGILEQVMWVVLPASVMGVFIGLSVFAGMYFGVSIALKRWAARAYESSETRSAPEIIRERYARGEISRREYEQLREDLEAGSQPLTQPRRA